MATVVRTAGAASAPMQMRMPAPMLSRASGAVREKDEAHASRSASRMAYIEKVGVVGAGAMGAAIAEVFALNGKQVVLKDVKDEFVQRGLKNVEASLNGLVQFHAGKAEREIERIESENGIKL